MYSAAVVSQNITVAEMRSWQEDIENEKYDAVNPKMEKTFHGQGLLCWISKPKKAIDKYK